MRHSLLAPGKRLRPVMTILAAECLGADGSLALDPGCAIELVHTASLIVDDLPCMDDAALRRGRRTTHTRFGMETAVLAAVALLNRAPAVIASCADLDETVRLRLIELLSTATGEVSGLASGQLKDLAARHETTDVEQLERIVREKTAALFVCAAKSGAAIAGADRDSLAALGRFAESFGVAFQILDDLADLEGSSEELRKDVGQDAKKATYASLLGSERAADIARRHRDEARAALTTVGLADSALARLAEVALAAKAP